MNKDFSRYKHIIDDFSGRVLNADFEVAFSAVAKNIPKTERFLLKMELKRLAAPCTRLIDLRGHVDGECRPFAHEGRTHFIDDIAEKVFAETFTRYNGYTFGVYEAVMNTENNFLVIYQKERNSVDVEKEPEANKVFEKQQYPAKFYSFGPYHNRVEERMNFAAPLQASFDDDTSIECTISDISVSGCKFRINGVIPIHVGQKTTLRFIGLENEFEFGRNNDFAYEVKNISIIDNLQVVGVERFFQQAPHQDSFTLFLKEFIQSNKRRYKINLDNTISALQSRAFEQYILPKSNELPIFMEKKEGTLVPRYALTCNNNHKVYQYWQDEKRYSTLYCLTSPERIARLKKRARPERQLLVFSFIHQSNGKSYFYTADNIQLADDEEFRAQFLAFAANKKSFAITQLSLLDVHPDRIESPLTLSDTLSKKNEYLNSPAPEEVKLKIANTPYIIVANDTEHSEAKKIYQSFSYEGINARKLKSFGHKRLSQPYSVDEVGINYRNQRQELRFKYKTPANIEFDNMKCQGVSRDFSTSGLKIELSETTALVKGNIVNISFPSLQKITSAFELNALPYEIIRVDHTKTVINLRVFVEKHQHIGRKFFKALIDKNRDKLTPDEYAMSSPGLAKALRNIYSSSATIPSLVVQTSGSRYKVEAVASGENTCKLMTAMHKLSDRSQYINLYPLIGHIDVLTRLTTSLKKIQHTDSAKSELLYIAINARADMVGEAVTTKMATELGSEKLKHVFIQQALEKGDFFCVMIKLSRAAEPDMSHLNPELSYIGSYAIHRGKQIEQEIWSVAGVAQVFDVTQEELFRYHLTRKNNVSQSI
ncbi:PilZ domain-containing protein [Cognaticolwellia mytili]|uniref:PilZ domain-containing protein n=1 Tax=Cognaticolwellia mytili TaxID=1888913 RepID=UPI000A178038|nr:PilZ domain-containing protein [Cognaticolwellia mytili]